MLETATHIRCQQHQRSDDNRPLTEALRLSTTNRASSTDSTSPRSRANSTWSLILKPRQIWSAKDFHPGSLWSSTNLGARVCSSISLQSWVCCEATFVDPLSNTVASINTVAFVLRTASHIHPIVLHAHHHTCIPQSVSYTILSHVVRNSFNISRADGGFFTSSLHRLAHHGA